MSDFPELEGLKTKPRTKRKKQRQKVEMPLWLALILTLSIGLAIGYFAGREHLKYQIRESIKASADRFIEALRKSIFGDHDGK